MDNHFRDRRALLQGLGVAGLLPALPQGAFGANVVHEALPLTPEVPGSPQHSIRFAVCGMSHDHIYGMVGALQRGGGELVAAFGDEPDKLAAFTRRYPDVKVAKSEDEIQNDSSIQLVLSSTIASHRAPLGLR